MPDTIRQTPADFLDDECAESWERETDEPDLRDLGADLITAGEEPYWSISVAVAELLREDPLEAELRARMAAALRAVAGAGRVWEDDREVWGVTGSPSGEALIRAAAGVVDDLAPRARAHLDALGF